MKRILVILSILFLIIPFTAVAQDYCVGDFDFDNDCDGLDAALFKSDFGRSGINKPCPPDGPAPVEKTGQNTCYDDIGNAIDCKDTSQDGDLLKGVAWPSPRFIDHEDGTVTDNLTGLMWTKNANLPGEPLACPNARDYVAGMNAGTYNNFNHNDWRTPNIRELFSLVDMEYSNPSLTAGHPFINVQSYSQVPSYWSSTNVRGNPSHAWGIYMYLGNTVALNKNLPDHRHFIWPVRGGH